MHKFKNTSILTVPIVPIDTGYEGGFRPYDKRKIRIIGNSLIRQFFQRFKIFFIGFNPAYPRIEAGIRSLYANARNPCSQFRTGSLQFGFIPAAIHAEGKQTSAETPHTPKIEAI